MTGLEIKEKLVDSGYKLSDISQNMGVTPQSLHKFLMTEDIKTGVLERIAKAVNKDIMFFFGENDAIEDEIDIINNILDNRKQINYLYQRIVDVQILIKEYLKLPDDNDSVESAAEILNNLTRQYPQQWKEFDLNEKKLYNQKLKEAVRLLQDMFFERFKLLYNKMRGFK